MCDAGNQGEKQQRVSVSPPGRNMMSLTILSDRT